MVIIQHKLVTGKTVTDTYRQAVEHKEDRSNVTLFNRAKERIAVFRKADVVDLQVKPH
jgi:hypothetical protein